MKALANTDLKVWNKGDLELYDKILSPKIIRHEVDIKEDIIGIEANKENVTFNRTAFPDFKVTFNDLIIKGEKVVVRWIAKGTNTGPFGKLPPTGKKIKISGVTISHIVKKKVKEQWVFYNQAEVLTQLGIEQALFEQMSVKPEGITQKSRRVTEIIKEAAEEVSKAVEKTEPAAQKNETTNRN